MPFGTFKDGRLAERYVLIGRGGLSANIFTYGATVQSLEFAGKDVVLGYDTLDDYLQGGASQGASIGRYANRIAAGKFLLNGIHYDVGCNENGVGHLHGGFVGFDKKLWEARVVSDGEEPAVEFTTSSPDGEEGYPGNLQVSVIYTVTADNGLRLEYTARSDKDTVVNLTNHSYFNLNGWDGGDILDTQLTIFADSITPIDKKFIPTGEFMQVDGTPFDFRQAKSIGRDIGQANEQLKLGLGYDHNFILGTDRKMRHAVTAVSPQSGIRLDCYTDLPGVQLYTSNMLNEPTGKQGKPLYKYQGFCLETQFFPDSPNQSGFPSTTLMADQVYYSMTEYKFSKG